MSPVPQLGHHRAGVRADARHPSPFLHQVSGFCEASVPTSRARLTTGTGLRHEGPSPWPAEADTHRPRLPLTRDAHPEPPLLCMYFLGGTKENLCWRPSVLTKGLPSHLGIGIKYCVTDASLQII